MKKVFLILAALGVFAFTGAQALEIEGAKTLRPFRDEFYTVTLPGDGRVTVTAQVYGGVPETVLVEGERVKAGQFTFSWNGLLSGGEPAIKDTNTQIHVSFSGDDGTEDAGSIPVKISNPLGIITFAHPRTLTACPTQEPLAIDYYCTMDNTTVIFDIAGEDGTTVTNTVNAHAGAQTYFWNGRTSKGVFVPAGEYTFTVYTRANPEWQCSCQVTVTDTPEEALPLAVDTTWQPDGSESPEEMWAMLQEPVTVLKGNDGNGYKVREKPDENSAVVGMVTCGTAGLRIVGSPEDKYVRVGFYRREDAVYTEGYVARKDLETIQPSAEYGLVLDKRTQTLQVYYRGEIMGTLLVSTGKEQISPSQCLTRAGIYLTGDYLANFMRDGYWYNYPIRIDGPNLIHTAGMKRDMNGNADYSHDIAELGQRASHGCVRVDPRQQEENGLNMYYLYTHLERNTKIFVIENEYEHIPGREIGEFEVGEN